MARRLCIVGLGLMGGAVGLAARKTGAAFRVIGVTGRPETLQKAKQMGAVDEASLDLATGVREADLVILALPVRLIPEVARNLVPHCHPGTVVTDVGSSKAAVVAAVDEALARLKAQIHFVGSHPIAGSEKNGIDAAPEVVLAGACCAITPTPATDSEAYRVVDDFWKQLGMKTVRVPPEEHDAALARSSHLPHLLAFMLMNVQTPRSLTLSGSGLRDMTRLAGSDVQLWTDILAQNAVEMARLTRDFSRELARLGDELEALALAGTPGAEAARERLIHYLADSRQRHDGRFPVVLPQAEPPAEGETAPEGPSGLPPVVSL